MENNKVVEYIESNWGDCLKTVREDRGNLIGLPYPYTVPAVGYYDELYYFDNFFANLGLAVNGKWDLVKKQYR